MSNDVFFADNSYVMSEVVAHWLFHNLKSQSIFEISKFALPSVIVLLVSRVLPLFIH